DLLSFAIRQGESGRIAAARIVLEGGDGGLVEVSGELDARGVRPEDHGGQIDVLGEYIVIAAGARLDASGPAGGGSIHVGGGRHGGEGLRTARGTFVHPDAEMRADASDTGDGGEIIIWADETAQVHGSLSARGGPHGGHGGFVETSGLGWLDVTRAPKLMARSGDSEDGGGEWLIDPNNISIVDRPPDSQPCDPADPSCVPCNTSDGTCLDPGLSESERTNPIFFSPDVWGFDPGGPIIRPSVDDSSLYADLIEETLAQGINVWIWTNTVGDVPGDQAGDIRVEAEIRVDDATVDPDTEAKLVLWAANDIIINKFIGVDSENDPASTDPTNLALELDLWANSLYMNEAVTPTDELPPEYLGTLEINAGIESAGGQVFLQGVDLILSGDTNESGEPSGSIRTDGGNLTLISSGGDILLLGDIDTSSDVVTEQQGSRAGGTLQVNSIAIRRRPNNDEDNPQPSVVVGGSIVVKGEVMTGGGAIGLGAAGGGVDVDSSIASEGGDVSLFASAKSFPPETEVDAGDITAGGRIRLLNNANIETGGGDFTAGYLFDQTAQATEVVIQGRIDTGA
ncbi:MAG: hypothetical protein HRU37_14630, partial [Roseibacillus sp.]|nr:hypothetical protein [Roseibacillus sp.]